MTRVYVSIGSNIEPESQLRFSLAALRQHFSDLIVSPVYRSKAMGFDGPDFLNMVVAFNTDISAEQVHDKLNSIERESGRNKTGIQLISRTLDLDMLLYDNQIIDALHIPRDEIERYAFVLKPLCDIAPDLRHPVTGKSMLELWQGFNDDAQELNEVKLF